MHSFTVPLCNFHKMLFQCPSVYFYIHHFCSLLPEFLQRLQQSRPDIFRFQAFFSLTGLDMDPIDVYKRQDVFSSIGRTIV